MTCCWLACRYCTLWTFVTEIWSNTSQQRNLKSSRTQQQQQQQSTQEHKTNVLRPVRRLRAAGSV
jgi:hypothetical protein